MSFNFFIKWFFVVVAYFAPISNLIHIVLIFITIDFITGIYASLKNKEAIVSHRLRKTIEKFVFYTISIIVAYMFQHEIASWLNLDKIVAGFIAAIELLSIYENVKRITGLDIATRIKDYIMNNLLKLKK